MWFEELTLTKYGVYNSRTLSLPGAGLTVIYGPNETGKSTWLAAIRDFLYGIQPALTAEFGASAARIRAVIRCSDGRRLALQRRAGRRHTLLDENGKIVDEAVLTALLGRTTRDRYETLFGLRHRELEEGSNRLLEAEGDIGRLIIAAAGGLQSLEAALDGLHAGADRLFGPRKKSDRAFYRVAAEIERHERAIREATLTRDQYETSRQAWETAQVSLAGLQDTVRRLRARGLQLARQVRVIPSLGALETVESEIAGYRDLPDLPAEFPQVVKEALPAETTAVTNFHTASVEYKDANDALDAIVVPQAVLQAEARIRDLGVQGTHIRKQWEDRPHRATELDGSNAKCAAFKSKFGLEDLDLAATQPAPKLVEQAQRLAERGIALRNDLKSAQEQADDDRATLADLDRRLKDARADGYDRPFGVSRADLVSIPPDCQAIQTKQEQADTLSASLEARISTLGLTSVSALEALPCPAAAALEHEGRRRDDVDAALRDAGRARADEEWRRDQAAAEMGRLLAGGDVPTEAAIIAARQSRDTLWQTIRTVYLSDTPEPWGRLAVEDRRANADTFDGRTAQADTLADRKTIDAQRIATLTEAEKQHGLAVAALHTLDRRADELGRDKTALEDAWDRAWPELAALHPDVSRLSTFLTARADVLRSGQELATLTRELTGLRALYQPKLLMLVAAEQRLGLATLESAGIESRVLEVAGRIEAHDAAHQAFLADLRQRDTMGLRMAQHEAAVSRLTDDMGTWRTEWSPTMVGLRASPAATPEHGNALATEWHAIREVLENVRTTSRRLERMDEDERALEHDLAQAGADLGLVLPHDSVEAATMLVEQLERARELRTAHEHQTKEVARCLAQRNRAKATVSAAGQEVARLCQLAGCGQSDLAGVAARSARVAELRTERDALLRTIQTAGDGEALDKLRAERAGRSIDDVKLELEQVKRDEDTAEAKVTAAIAEVERLGNEFTRLQGGAGIGASVAEREQATAELQRVVEEYTEIVLTEQLIRAAIDHVRQRRQDPLMARAGEVFAAATAGAFAGIGYDVHDGRPVVVGVRPDGNSVGIEAMSDGARDQLFLAFRVASLKQYCEDAEPLPFVADDLLVNFDDDRTGAILPLLADLGDTTQVLLFTHHRMVRDSAKRLVSEGRAPIVEIEEGATA